jgi:hypothetical protein
MAQGSIVKAIFITLALREEGRLLGREEYVSNKSALKMRQKRGLQNQRGLRIERCETCQLTSQPTSQLMR